MFALVDVNSFYASCEAIFRPDLAKLPIVVLSNNDGCVIARNGLAKKLGIKMGVPFFQIKEQVIQDQIAVFSSNYALYADMSNRVMTILEQLGPALEIYSIDEAFMAVAGINNLPDFAAQVKGIIQKYTGLTVGVGIGQTKTLAKLANYAAKKWTKTNGIVVIDSFDRQTKLLSLVPVEEVWGVGRQLSKKLQQLGIKTALDLANSNPITIRKYFNVVLERTVRELNGESCLSLEEVPDLKKQIICSRSFGSKITAYQDMKQAICAYAERAAEKLRVEKQYCKSVAVFIKTSPFSQDKAYFSDMRQGHFAIACNDSRDIISMAVKLLMQIWRDGQAYQKAGVILNDFYSDSVAQFSLFDEYQPRLQSAALMSVIDKLNQSKHGKIWFAGQGIKQDWQMKRELLSPSYTTNWRHIPRVKVK